MVKKQPLFSGNSLMESSLFQTICTQIQNAHSFCFSNRTLDLLSHSQGKHISQYLHRFYIFHYGMNPFILA